MSSERLSDAARLCLLLSHPRLGEESATAARDLLLSSSFDWGEFIDLAWKHRVVFQIAENVERYAIGPMGRMKRAQLIAAAMYNQARTSRLFDELIAITRRLEAAGLPYAVRKGAYFLATASRYAATRHMVDFDVYIRRSDTVAVSAILERLGYRQGKDSPDGRTMAEQDRRTAMFWAVAVNAAPPFVRLTSDPYVGSFAVDLRFDLFEPRSGVAVAADFFLERAQPVELPGARVRVLDDVCALIDIAGHLYREATTLSSIEAGKDICLYRHLDVVVLVDRLFPHHWGRFEAAVGQLGAQREIFYALWTTDVLYPGVLPPDAASGLDPGDRAYLDDFGQVDGQPQTWSSPFLARAFDRDRRRMVTGSSRLPRPRPQWGQRDESWN